MWSGRWRSSWSRSTAWWTASSRSAPSPTAPCATWPRSALYGDLAIRLGPGQHSLHTKEALSMQQDLKKMHCCT